jgi:diaminopimelate epimerase
MNSSLTGTYGHGTENDFVIVFDPEDQNNLSSKQTAAICNRATGIGADGLIRITKRDGKWFMGGNGIRVMARYLVDRGHQPSGIFSILTRDGAKYLSVPDSGDISVNMGQVQILDGEITAANNGKVWSGYNVSVGNPHAVVFVESMDHVGELKDAPVVRPKETYPEGVNVEFVEFLSDNEMKMRVHERGSGETRSCGTGTCAVALAATAKKGLKLPARWVINPPGGRLIVEIDPHSNATLTGPAVLLAEHNLEPFLV